MKKMFYSFVFLAVSTVPLFSRYTLSTLPYDYDALEPVISEEIMLLHHKKHEQGYVTNLNAALSKHPNLFKKSLDDLLQDLSVVPKDIRDVVRNHGGGVKNHQDFWKVMTVPGKRKPTGRLLKKIKTAFGSFSNFKAAFEKKAKQHFGSGWVWLCMNSKGQLFIATTKDQDTPLSEGNYPLLGLDLWEHAYYLKYHNKRSNYVSAWWSVVKWKQVEANYKDALRKNNL